MTNFILQYRYLILNYAFNNDWQKIENVLGYINMFMVFSDYVLHLKLFQISLGKLKQRIINETIINMSYLVFSCIG